MSIWLLFLDYFLNIYINVNILTFIKDLTWKCLDILHKFYDKANVFTATFNKLISQNFYFKKMLSQYCF
jgi:hypothetical protein